MDFLNELKALITEKKKEELRKKVIDSHPYDVATALNELDDEEIDYLFSSLDEKEVADILEYVDEEEAAKIIERMETATSANIIQEMESDDAIDIIKSLDDETKEKIVSYIPKEQLTDMKELASYDETEAGSIMTNNYLKVESKCTIPQVMKILINESNEQEIIDTIFVINEKKELVGLVDLKKLIIARKDTPLHAIMETKFKSCQDTSKISSASTILKEYSLLVLPVLHNKVLKGIITIDDVIDFVDEDKNDDYDKLAGLAGDNDTKVSSVFKSRIPWLLILMVLSFIVSTVLGLFEEIIASATILVFFQTLILDMGGNAGTQSLASSVVRLSKQELETKKQVKNHLGKEVISGLALGLILGICAFIITFIFMLIKGNVSHKAIISLVIGLSMSLGIFISNFMGSLIPIFLSKIKIDPAVASGPFITTLNDVLGVVIYYSIAYIILIDGGLL